MRLVLKTLLTDVFSRVFRIEQLGMGMEWGENESRRAPALLDHNNPSGSRWFRKNGKIINGFVISNDWMTKRRHLLGQNFCWRVLEAVKELQCWPRTLSSTGDYMGWVSNTRPASWRTTEYFRKLTLFGEFFGGVQQPHLSKMKQFWLSNPNYSLFLLRNVSSILPCRVTALPHRLALVGGTPIIL